MESNVTYQNILFQNIMDYSAEAKANVIFVKSLVIVIHALLPRGFSA